tara:strand:+ start:161 stop:352 length:192 start_codon:yes stop_codon:yes gene_type:complete
VRVEFSSEAKADLRAMGDYHAILYRSGAIAPPATMPDCQNKFWNSTKQFSPKYLLLNMRKDTL